MNRKLFLLQVAMMALLNHPGAQPQDDRIPKVIPPSPNAAALQRYGEVPITAYTGVPNISIPLYEIKSGELSVPVSISYNASGIRVADEASRVGLGWALNAGGLISRTVVGGDDFEFPTYSYNYQSSFEIPKAPRFDQGQNFNLIDGCNVTLNGYGINYTIPPGIFTDGGNYDLQPDQYSYNFVGRSGKFVLRRNRDVVLNNVEKIDIKLAGPDANSWEIRTPDGTIYRFEQIESYVDYGGTGTAHKSSWYLTKIISQSGRTIQFIYSSFSAYIHSVGSYFESKSGANLSENSTGQAAPTLFSNYSAAVSGKWYSNVYLSKIVFDAGEVHFNYLADRPDVANDLRLTDIKIYSKKSGEVDQLIKTWNFNYSYFEGNNFGGGYNANATADNLSKRLKLSSLQLTAGGSSMPPYEFSYNNETDPASVLPGKLSFSRDHWGYYNGRNNSSLVPSFIGGCNNDPVAFYLGVMGNEREPDPFYNQLFTLNKIKYPTGGYTAFEYETNDFDIANSIINDHSYFANYVGTKPAVAAANFSNIQTGGTFSGTLDLSGMTTCGQTVQLITSFIKTSGLAPGSGITYSLKNSAGIDVGGGYIDSYLGNTTPPMTEYLGTQQANTGLRMTLDKALLPDVYTWTISVPSSVNLNGANAYINYSRLETVDPIMNGGDIVHNALFGGGLRIKRIADYTEPGSAARIKRYKYHYRLNGKVYSYGRRMSKPNYSYFNEQTGVAGQNPITGLQIITKSNVLIRESDSNIPLNGSAGGSTVGYDKVEELIGENGENGKTVYEYQNQPDIIFNYTQIRQAIGQYTNIPRKPPFGGSVANPGNGNLTRQTDYALKDGSYVAVKEQVNTYQDLIPVTSSAAVLGIEKRTNAGSNPFVATNCYITNYVYPSITENRPVLVSSVAKTYDIYSGSAPIIVNTEYTYDNSTHLQLKSKSEYKSNGDKITTSYTYPADYPDIQCDAALLQMKNTNYMHALPVTQQVTLTKGTDQFLTDAQVTRYQVSNGKITIREKAGLEINQPLNINTPPAAYNPASGVYPTGYAARVYFDNYDATGNITQVHKSDDISISYIWDYYNNYPIAEITNAASANCAFTSFEADGSGNWTFNGQPLNDLSAFSGTRSYTLNGSNNISKFLLDPSQSYIVSYWSKGGPAIVNGSVANAVTSRVGWTYYEQALPLNTSAITITGSVTIDELRLFPKGALVTTFTYAPLTGMTSQCDPNNRISYFEYDAFQRLKLIRDQDGNIVKTIDYRYKQ